MEGTLSLLYLCSSLEGMCSLCLFLFAPKFGWGLEELKSAMWPLTLILFWFPKGQQNPKPKEGTLGPGDVGPAWPCCQFLFLV